MRNLAIITNIVPIYRKALYDRLVAHYKGCLTIYCQDCIPGSSVATVDIDYPNNIRYIRYWVANNEFIGWQCLPLRELSRFDIVFIYGNPRLLSNVFYSLILRILGCRVIIWGQVHSAGASPLLEKIRLLWWRWADALFVYTDEEVKQLQKHGFTTKPIIGMNNGLNQRAIDACASQWTVERLTAWKTVQNLHGIPVVLSCARLIEKNEFQLMVTALADLRRRGMSCIWLVIGDGPLRESLKEQAKLEGVADQISWQGEIYPEEELAPWFLSADLFVHPSAIGLSLLHAMGYGLPVITHGNADKHMPEFAAFIADETGLTFQQGDAKDLADKIEQLLVNAQLRKSYGKQAREITRRQYNTDIMADRFIGLVNKLTEEIDHA